MKIQLFSEDQKNYIWTKARLNLIDDDKLTNGEKIFAIKFLALRFIEGEPKGLTYSNRELAIKFKMSYKHANRCMNSLITFEYILMKDAKDRRKLYIPTEKLTGIKETDTPDGRGDMRNITSDNDHLKNGTKRESLNDFDSGEYTLYNKYGKQKTYSPEYAEWNDIEPQISAILRNIKGCLKYKPQFQTSYKHHPIPLEKVLSIANTFSEAYNKKGIKTTPEQYITGSFKAAEIANKNEMLGKIETRNYEDSKKLENKQKDALSREQYLSEIAYCLNTGKRIVNNDIPKNILNYLEDTGKVLTDNLGFVKRSENIIFYTLPNKPTVYSASINDIDILKRKNVNIPGIEAIYEKSEY